jgi:SAM-dependent methyltransferase
MAAFVERSRCPACGSGATTTLLSRDFSHPSVWGYVAGRYHGRVGRRELAGRAHEVARCALCRLLFHRYVLSDPALARLYDDWAEEPEPVATTDALGGLPEAPAARRVLDLGAGDGEFCAAAREAGCDVIAIEIAPARLASLRDRGFQAYACVEEVGCSDIALARCHEILEHLPRPFETLRAIAARLAPSGRIELSVPDASSQAAALPRGFWSARDDELRPLEHVNGFTPRTLRLLARALGLSYEPPDRGAALLRRRPKLELALARPASGGAAP